MEREHQPIAISIFIFLFMVSGIFGVSHAQSDYYVDAVYGDDGNAGTSWAAAKATIQAGLDLVTGADALHVAEGIYAEQLTLGHNGLELLGGYPSQGGARNPDVYESVIDGGGSGVPITINGVSAVVVDGFIITNGTGANGGGIVCVDTTAALQNNRISACTCTGSQGGAAISITNSDVDVLANYITSNISESSTVIGGAVSIDATSVVDMISNELTGNLAHSTGGHSEYTGGGAVSNLGNLTAAGNIFSGNEARSTYSGGYNGNLQKYAYGGAIYCGDGSITTLSGNTYSENLANSNLVNTNSSRRAYSYAYGGAIYCGTGSDVEITNDVIELNTASAYGQDTSSSGRGYAWTYGGGIFCEDLSVVGIGTGVKVLENYCDSEGVGSGSYDYAYTYGGGISLRGADATVVVDGVLVQDNHMNATPDRGTYGGGVYISSGTAEIVNCMIVENLDDGAYFTSGYVDFFNNTVAYNSGYGVYVNSGTANIKNCILWGHVDDLYGAGLTYSNIQEGLPGEGNLDPPCDPLFFGSGNYHIRPNSCCIDRGTVVDAPDHDYDGEARPFGGGYDIGADEASSTNPTATPYSTPSGTYTPVPTPSANYYVDGDFGDDGNDGLSWATAKASIQEALDAAGGVGGGVVHVAISIYYENIVIPDNIRLLGGYAHGGGVRNPDSFITIIDGYDMDSAVKISGVSNVFVEGFVIRNGHGGYGGGIYVSHASGVEITGNKIRENECASQPALPNLALGGGLYLHGHDILIHDNLITENLADGGDGYGGGIYCAGGGSVHITNNLLTYNTAQVAGGAIFINHPDAALLIDDNTIQWNMTDGPNSSGGALYISNGSSVTVSENVITDNQAYRSNTADNEAKGGGIYCAGELTLTENEIKRNEAYSYYDSGYGDRLYLYAYGGALYCADGSVVNASLNDMTENVARTYAKNNSSGQRGYGYSYGGAFYCDGGSTLVLSAQPLYNNTSYAYGQDTASSGRGYANAYGGGIHLADNSNVTLGLGCPIIENKSNAEASGSGSYDYAYSYGGGISIEGPNTQTLLDRLIIRGNETNSSPDYVRRGGGIYVNETPVEIINNFIVQNVGDGAYLTNTSLSFQHNTVADNTVYGLYVNSGSPTVKNCILWNNGDDLYGVTATYCDILDADAGEGNLDPPCDPLFIGGDDYHLMSNSCCIDRGSPYEVPTHDCDGEVRPYSFTFPDIGADETTSTNPSPTPYSTPSGTITPIPTPSNNFYVDGQTGDDSNDGLSWATARKSINGAMQLAEAAGGGNVHVAMWTYYERVICPNNVRVYGGYSHDGGIRNPTAYPTIIDGSGERIGIMISGVESVFVDGFIIRNCRGGYGGGIYVNDSAHIYITGNTIQENHVSDAGSKSVSLGAGIYVNAHDVNIINNLITDNYAEGGTGYGGGIYCADGGSVYIAENTIKSNTAGSVGGGIALDSPTWKLLAENNLFDGNIARSKGGAIHIESMSSADVLNNTFLNNSTERINSADAEVFGGAIHCSGDLTVTGNTFTGNQAYAYYDSGYGNNLYEYAYGGAISCGDGSVVLTFDNVYQGNRSYAYAKNNSSGRRGYAYSYGGAIYCAGGSHITITSETIEDNTAFSHGIDTASSGRGYGYSYGGGLVCDDNATVDFGLNVVITGNTADANGDGSSSDAAYAYGGGMAVLGLDAEVEFDRMIIKSNIATASPNNIQVGGVYVNQTPVVIYNTFIIEHTGDGLYLNNSDAVVINNTIAYNFDYGIRANGGSPTVKNCILWGNFDDLNGVSATYSNIQSGDPGEGNLDPPCDPLFISGSDYHIHPYSCCVDRGTYYDIPDHDFDGDARPFGAARPDIGADETTGANPTPSPYITPAGTPTAGPSPTPGTDFYVDGLAGDDADDGLTWSTARASINSAMELVEDAGGGVIHVAGHIYNECVICASNLTLLGGYPHGGGVRNPAGFPTYIDPNGIGTAVIISNVANVNIDGFIVRDGHGGLGGGFHVSRAHNILINNNKIRENYCNTIPGGRNVAHGAGLYLEGTAITVCNNEITNNYVEPNTGYGGGIYCGPGQDYAIHDNTIGYNTSRLAGGGIALISVGSTVDIHDNLIEANQARNSQAKGGGIYIDANSSALVTYNTITENSSYCYNNSDSHSMGGGIYTESELLITQNDFIGNEAHNYYSSGYGNRLYNYAYGGAVYCGPGSTVVSYDNNYTSNASYCYAQNNSSGQRGYAYSYGGVFYCSGGGELTLSNETYIENTAYSYGIDTASSGRGFGYSYGGAVAAGDESTVHIGTGIVIVNNYADANGSGSGSYDYAYAYGAGLAFLGSNAVIDVQRVEIKENYASASPNNALVGGVYINDAPVEFYNNFVVDNTGDGMYLNTTTARVINNTIAYNTVQGIYVNGGDPVIKNCILWGHTDDLVGGSATYCDIENGDAGEGNMDPPCNPVFVGNGDYHLHPGSCCIDRGTSIDVPAVDFDGDTRPYNFIADIGADETQIMNPTPDPSITPNTPTPTGSPTPTPAAEYYVDKYLGDDADDGLSWGSAKASIRGALDAATAGGLIHITRGTYYERLPLHDGITLMGGYPVGGGTRDPETYITILKGTVGGSPIMITNSENIAMTGLTITGGNEGNGGGFFCYGGSHIQVYDCIFDANEAGGDGNLARGGAVYIASSFDVWIHDCLFINNSVAGTNDALGGAMYIFDSGLIDIENNIFQDNTSPHAGGAIYCTDVDSSVVFTENLFQDNMAKNSGTGYTVYGGAIYCDAAASPLITNNTFLENTAYGTGRESTPKGGAIYSEGSSTIIDNIFDSNEARSYYSSGYGNYLYEYAYGGAVYAGESSSLTLESNHFTGNKAYVYAQNNSSSERSYGYSYGGAIYCTASSTTSIDHCTIVDNTAYTFAGEPASSGRGYAYSYGGGLYADTGATIVVNQQSAFWNNKAHSYADANYREYGYSYGGGIYIYEGVASIQLDRIEVKGNDSISQPDNTSVGDGIYIQDDDPISITNCFLTDNGGYGMFCATAGTNIEFIHNTVGGNGSYGIYVNAGSLDILNSVVWDNGDDLYGVSAEYSDIEDGDAGLGNISADPVFVGAGDYHITETSPCINTALTLAGPSLIEVDYDANDRPQEDDFDMGADEYAGLPEFNLTVLLDGYYAGGSQPATTVDLEFRSGSSPQTADTVMAVMEDVPIDSSGQTGDIDLVGIPGGDLYLVINHLNHLDVITSERISVNYLTKTTVNLADDTDGDYAACYGSDPQQEEPDGLYSLRGGNANGDGYVNAAGDFVVWLAANGSSQGGPGWDARADFNGDTVVNSSDYSVWLNQNGRITYVPEASTKNDLLGNFKSGRLELRYSEHSESADAFYIVMELLCTTESISELIAVDAAIIYDPIFLGRPQLTADYLRQGTTDVSLGLEAPDWKNGYHYSRIALPDQAGVKLQPGENILLKLKFPVRLHMMHSLPEDHMPVGLASGFSGVFFREEFKNDSIIDAEGSDRTEKKKAFKENLDSGKTHNGLSN